jgi:hypothetical protein
MEIFPYEPQTKDSVGQKNHSYYHTQNQPCFDNGAVYDDQPQKEEKEAGYDLKIIARR